VEAESADGPDDGPVDRARVLALAEAAGFPCVWSGVDHRWVAGDEDWRVFVQAASDAAVREVLARLAARGWAPASYTLSITKHHDSEVTE
jgi:hypothetical protein